MTMLYGIVSLVGSNPTHVLFGPDGPASITGSEAGPWDMTGTSTPASKGLSWRTPTVTGFDLYCETAGATDDVGIIVQIDDD